MQAIAYHDGQYVDDNRCVAAKEEKLTLLLQYTDNWSGFVTELMDKVLTACEGSGDMNKGYNK